MNPLKPKDEVYIKSLNMIGTVLRARPGDKNEAEEFRGISEIQITRYFLRTDLELDDTNEQMQKRQAAIKVKEARLESARKKV